jgi:hypothetical protein
MRTPKFPTITRTPCGDEGDPTWLDIECGNVSLCLVDGKITTILAFDRQIDDPKLGGDLRDLAVLLTDPLVRRAIGLGDGPLG